MRVFLSIYYNALHTKEVTSWTLKAVARLEHPELNLMSSHHLLRMPICLLRWPGRHPVHLFELPNKYAPIPA